MLSEIQQFVLNKFLLTLSVNDENEIWSANCFYIFELTSISLIITSALDTKHSQLMLKNPRVSGTIATETRAIQQIEGIQFIGNATLLENPRAYDYQKLFFNHFKAKQVFETPMWEIKLLYVKYTTNKKKFGEKLIWVREDNDLAIS